MVDISVDMDLVLTWIRLYCAMAAVRFCHIVCDVGCCGMKRAADG